MIEHIPVISLSVIVLGLSIYTFILRRRKIRTTQNLINECFNYNTFMLIHSKEDMNNSILEFADARISLMIELYKEQFAELLKQFTSEILNSEDFKSFSMVLSYLKKELLKAVKFNIKHSGEDYVFTVQEMIKLTARILNTMYVKQDRVSSLMVYNIYDSNRHVIQEYFGQIFLFAQTSKLKLDKDRKNKEIEFNSFIRGV
jgi:hypothetical protein